MRSSISRGMRWPDTQRRLGQVQRQPEAGEPVEDARRSSPRPSSPGACGVCRPIASIRMPASRHALDQALVRGRQVEVVEQQGRRRVGLRAASNASRTIAMRPRAQASRVMALLLVEHGHDDGLVDHVPGVDHAGEVGDLAPIRARTRRSPRRSVRSSSHGGASVCQTSGWPLTATPRSANQRAAVSSRARVGPAPHGFEAAPVERQRRGVEQVEPELGERSRSPTCAAEHVRWTRPRRWPAR